MKFEGRDVIEYYVRSYLALLREYTSKYLMGCLFF